MNKLFTLLLLLVEGIGGCHSYKPKPVAIDIRPALNIDEKLPRAVHNVCLNVWAVKTEEAVNACFDCGTGSLHPDFFFGHQLANKENGTKDQDSSSIAEIGNEYQFKDSATAMRVYNAFCYRRDRPKQVADSIFKCHHSYN